MFEFKKIPEDKLEKIINNASQKLGINEVVLEKDYWVCFLLNYLFSSCKWKDSFTFKGGTSLSKCYNLIERFSEDIDLILDWRVIGYKTNEPWIDRSNTKQDKFNKEANKRTEEFLRNEFIPQMERDFTKLFDNNYSISLDENNPQTVLFEYPKVFNSFYLTQAVRLEIGTLAAMTPAKDVNIIPEIKKLYPNLFNGEYIKVKTVLPERTFWEKITILHHEANRPKHKDIPRRYARHYYDVYCIADSIYKDRAFNNCQLLEKVVKFKNKFYPRKWAKYDEATLKSIRLMPAEYRFKELKNDYDAMSEMFYGKYPSFDNLMQMIRDLEDEIHKIPYITD